MSGTSQPRLSLAGFEKKRERCNSDAEASLLHMMRQQHVIPQTTNIEKTLDFYAMMHSIEVSTENASVLAATLANGGVCPLTGRLVLQPVTVRNTLSLMHSCGMGAESGEFAFKVGIPAKYCRTGAVILAVPGVLGACFQSPGVDHMDVPIRAKHFFTQMSERYSFHPYETTVRCRRHPRSCCCLC